MKKPRIASLPMVALIVAVVILALAGLGLLGAYFLLARPAAVADTGWVNPLAGVNAQRIAPDIAVLTLAGESDDRVSRAALEAGETETAYVTVAHSVLLSDQLRAGQWLLIANATAQTDPGRALTSYQAALDESTLGAALNDLARADVALQCARGFARLGRSELARLATAQAENVARYSLTLLPAQRRAVLGQVADAYEDFDQPDAARAVRQNLEAYSAGPGVEAPRMQLLVPTLRGAAIRPADVAAALATRQQAAAVMAARWLSTSPADREPLVQTLGEALLIEDSVRSNWYGTSDTLDLPSQIALLHDRIAWLALKHRMARLGYGVSIVPDWEAQGGQIQIALTDAYTELVNSYGRQLDTLDAVEGPHARVELLRQALLWTRLGLFPGDAEAQLRTDLTEASRQLWSRQGATGLAVVSQEVNGRLLYLLAGAEGKQSPSAGYVPPTRRPDRVANVGRP